MLKYFYAHFLKANEIVLLYDRQQPLHLLLKDYFRKHKECGSKDRRNISQLVYNYFRLGNALPHLPFDERLAVANYLIDNLSGDKNAFALSDALEERIENIKNTYPDFSLNDLFPFSGLLTDKTDKHQFAMSFLKRPLVWLRVDANHINEVESEFKQLDIVFNKLEWGQNKFESWHVANESKVTETESFKKGFFEIQDLSSQQCSKYFDVKPQSIIWDCCSGAGGKSLLIHNIQPDIKIVATDVRQQSLNNLIERFIRAGIKNYETYVADASQPFEKYPEKSFDLIIADVPCSGSGTWARTPEMIVAFDRKSLFDFSERQFSIALNAFRYLKPGGRLIYITCSVFETENEAVVKRLSNALHSKPHSSDYIFNYDLNADSMFVTVFGKNDF